jgi:hypothetical protein
MVSLMRGSLVSSSDQSFTGGCYRICYPTQHNRTKLDHINMVG